MRRLRRRAAALRRAGLSVLAAAAVVLAPTPAAAADATLQVVSIDTASAPEVTLTVATPPELAGSTLDTQDFEVRESGKLRKATVTGLPSDPMDVVLVLDTSGSMRGEALDATKAAGIEFLSELPLTVPVAVVGFGNAPYIVSGFTTDRGALVNAINALQATGETALYDGVTTGAGLFTGPGRRALVLLSDGKDTASVGSLDQAIVPLVGSKAAFYGVLLQTAEQGIPALGALAAASGGRVVPASDPAALADVYTSIASELSSQYQLTIRAVGAGSIGFTVTARAGDITATGSGRALLPESSAAPAPADLPAPKVVQADAGGVFDQGWALAVGLATLFVGLLLGALLVLRPTEGRSQLASGRRLRVGGGRISALADQATGYAQERLERSGKASGLNRSLEQAGIAMRPGEFAVLVATSAFCIFALFLLLGNVLVAALAAPLVVVVARGWVKHQATKRQHRFGEQLEQTLPLMASSLRAGFGLMQAIDAVARESESPTADEFRRVVTETRLGRDLSDSLQAMADRVGNEDFHWVVQAIEIHRQVGGDLAEVLDNVDATIRGRNRVRRQISSLSAEGRMSALILLALPVFVVMMLQLLNPGYLSALTTTTLGWVLAVGAVVLMILGGLWMRRITRLVF